VKRLIGTLTSFLCLAGLGIAVFAILVPAVLGMQRYVITGVSMTGTIPKGSVAYAKLVPVADLRVGDVITFIPPGMASPVTHRIISIETAEDGELVFRTKGDFNRTADPWQMTLKDASQARYSFHVPYLGYVLAALTVKQVRMALIGLPALIIALSLIWSLWRQAGEEVARQEQQAAGVSEAAVEP
jgi:signal peptidase